jgi:uncharacterized Zn-finger protein
MNGSVVYIETLFASCKGGNESDGHPHVYLDLEKKGEIVCPYCSRHFVLKQKMSAKKELSL